MSSKRIKIGKVFQKDEYEYSFCVLNDKMKENEDCLKYLYFTGKLEKEHLLDLGIARWNFYTRFGDTYEFMLQRIKCN